MKLMKHNPYVFVLAIVIIAIVGACTKTKKEFYAGGELKSEIQYKNKKRNGTAIYYFLTGTQQMLSHYEDDRLNGVLKTWYFNGNTQREEFYVNDTLHQKSKKYYENGKLQLEVNYDMGKLHGSYLEYHENGQIKVEGSFVHDLYDGEWVYYDVTGILIGRGKYEAGKGIHVSFHYNSGDTLVKTQYLKNEKHGPEIWYNIDGTIRETVFWENGVFQGRERTTP